MIQMNGLANHLVIYGQWKVKEFYVREPGATKPYKDEEQASYILA